MRPSLLRLALAASLAATLPAVCAENARPAAPAPSPLWDAAASALREFQAGADPRMSLPARFERLAAFRFSPETAAKLARLFGTDRPVTTVRMPAPKNGLAYRSNLAPLHYVGPDGTSTDWSELTTQSLLDPTGRSLTMEGSWPSMDMQDKNMRFAMRKLTLAGKQHTGFAGMLFGTVRVDVERMSAESPSGAMPPMVFEGIHLDSGITERARAVDVRYAGAVKALTVGAERVDDVHWAIRIDNIDKHALAALKAASERTKPSLAHLTPEQQGAAMRPMLNDFAKAMALRGAAIEIDDISAVYQGSRASLKGRIGIEGATRADLDAIPALVKKIVARFEVKVPLAIVRAVSAKVAQKQMDAQHPGTPPDPQAAAQMGQTIADVVVGKLINAGYARIDNDVLVSTVEWRNGVLRANGKEVDLPKPQQPGQARPPQPGNAPQLRARRIDESCKLPGYPEDVVRQDLPLQLTLRFVVGADGRLRGLALAQPSQWPAWDQAVLAAAAGCMYIPALRDGKPVEAPMTWQVVREPGSLRP